MRAAPGPYAWLQYLGRLLECRRQIADMRWLDVLQALQFADDPGGDRDGAGAGVRIGAMRARRAHVEAQPERALLAEAQRVAAARLAVQAAIAEDLGMMLDQVARAPGTERLLIRDGAERQPAMQRLPQFMQIKECEQRGGRAAFHVAGAAAVDLAVDQFAAPGIDGPAGRCPPETRPCARSTRDGGLAQPASKVATMFGICSCGAMTRYASAWRSRNPRT